MDANLLPQVAFDSSIARIPRPGDAIDFYKIMKETKIEEISEGQGFTNAFLIVKLESSFNSEAIKACPQTN